MASSSLLLVEMVAAVRVSEGPVVEVQCLSGFEVELPVSSACFSSASSVCVVTP